MTDGPDLLERILAEPGEDLHRLQYADWLDEHAGTLACPTCSPCTKDPRVAPGRVPVIGTFFKTPPFLTADNLKPYVEQYLESASPTPILYRPVRGDKGYGYEARPMPPTAQPVTRVTLTTMPEVEYEVIPPGVRARIKFAGEDWRISADPRKGERAAVVSLLEYRWKGITFDFSSAAPG